jgi:hypothetical protein
MVAMLFVYYRVFEKFKFSFWPPLFQPFKSPQPHFTMVDLPERMHRAFH